MKRIEPTLGDMTILEATPAEREASRRRRLAKARYERLMKGQRAVLVFFGLLSGLLGSIGYLAPAEQIAGRHSPLEYLVHSGIMFGTAYMTTRRGITGLVFALGMPAIGLIADLIYLPLLSGAQFSSALMVAIGLTAAVDWRRSRA